MNDMITYVVEYEYWYRDRDGEWDHRPYTHTCFNEPQALLVATRLRNDPNVVRESVEVIKLDNPYTPAPYSQEW